MEIMLHFHLSFAIQDYTKKGVQIPLPDGINLVEDVVKYHNVSYDKSGFSIQLSMQI